MINQQASRESFPKTRRSLRYAVALLLLLAPIPFGSVSVAAVATLGVVCAAIGAAGLAVWLRDPVSIQIDKRILFAALAVMLIGAIQLIPIPSAVRTTLGSGFRAQAATIDAVPEVGGVWSSATLDRNATLDALIRWCALGSVATGAAVSITQRRHLRSLLRVLTISGAGQAAYGIAEFLTGRQHILWIPKAYFLEEATGTFVNRNHFAGFLAISLPAAIACTMVSPGLTGASRTFRERVMTIAERGGAARAFYAVCAVLIASGILLSYSRGGLLALAAGGIGMLVFGRARKRDWLVVAFMLVLPWFSLMFREIRAPGERLFESGPDASLTARLIVWKTTAGIATGHPWLGTGLGTFESAFELNRPATVDKRWIYAHSDWLQAWSEGGLPLVIALSLGFVWATHRTLRGAYRTHDFIRAGFGVAIILAGILGAYDFTLRIPAVSVTLAVLIGCAATRIAGEVPSVSRIVRRP